MADQSSIRVVSADRLLWRGKTYRCAIGKAGFTHTKQEGDNKTPLGSYPLRCCYYRPDKMAAPETCLPAIPLRPDMGWCDEPSHADYNHQVALPCSVSHETLWREDDAYNVIVPLGYNDAPVMAGKGSAIFWHVAQPDFRETEGCVAMTQQDLLAILREITPDVMMDICPVEKGQ